MNYHKKLRRIYIGLIILVLSLLALWLYQLNRVEPVPPLVNQIRVIVHPIYDLIKETDLTGDMNLTGDLNLTEGFDSKGALKSNESPEGSNKIKSLLEEEPIRHNEIIVSFLDLTGKVIYTTGKQLKVGDMLLLEESLYMDQSYMTQSTIIYNETYYKLSMPVYHLDKVNGFVMFEVRDDILLEDINTTSRNLHTGLAIATGTILFLLVALGGVELFHNTNSELEELKNGLDAIAKGQLETIDLSNQTSTFNETYLAYNNMVEELSYVLNQQTMNEGKRKQFLTMISHELKTPLATINAYVEGLMQGVAKDTESQNRYLNIIHQKMNQLTIQIEELFKYAQETADQFKYHFEECYCDELFDNIVNTLEPDASLKLNIQNLIPKCIVSADRVRMEQVVLNIYNNAIKHSKNNSCINIVGYRQDYEVFIEISDNGDGIEPADLPYIFDYYYQGQTSRKEDYEGVGLGLAICREIMIKHSGQIKVKSQVGIGTTFMLQIPVV